MPKQAIDCPADGELRAYLDREVPLSFHPHWEDHLSACSRCRDRIESLQADAELIDRALRETSPTAPDVAAAWRRLQTQETLASDRPQPSRITSMNLMAYRRWHRPILTTVAAAALLTQVMVTPIRTAAAQFLDVFRVKQIRVMTFDPEQVVDSRARIFERIVRDEAANRTVADAAEAAGMLGLPVLTPASVPEGYVLAEFSVSEPSSARAWIDIEAARTLLDAAGLPTDILPQDPDARVISALIPARAMQRYRDGDASFTVLQVASPEVSVPRGVDAERIGEVGLRLLGYPAEQAAALAKSINWATTLVLPVPLGEASAREVTVQGVTGFVLEDYESEDHTEATLVWEKDEVVYAVGGNVSAEVLLYVAQSLR